MCTNKRDLSKILIFSFLLPIPQVTIAKSSQDSLRVAVLLIQLPSMLHIRLVTTLVTLYVTRGEGLKESG